MMKKLSLISGLVVASVMELAAPSDCEAQQPKLDIKLFVGGSGTTYVEMLETERRRNTFAGWQVGFGARVRKRRWFVETLFSFNRWALRLSEDVPINIEGTDIVVSVSAKGQVNSFELPIMGGFIPYQNPYFKLFLYAGYVNHFNTKIVRATGTVEDPFGGDPIVVGLNGRPKSIGLVIYQAIARFGVSVDLAMFNIDFNYSISMNSAGTDTYRTSYHQLQLNVGYLF